MINQPVLDVAIGLIFIYVLYSLLATTIKEMLAATFAYRGKMLERGLEQMLDGKNYYYFSWDKLFNFFRVMGKTWPKFSFKELWGDEYKASSYINHLMKSYCETNQTSTLKDSTPCKKAKLFTSNVTKHPLYVRSSEHSLLSKKPAYLAPETFSNIIIDLFSPDGNTPVLLKDIATKINSKNAGKNVPLNDATVQIFNIYLAQANGDLQKFKSLLETWYNESMDRVSGWYKKQAFWILLIIGLILAIAFNVDTIAIVQKLSDNKDLREAMVKSASDYVKTNSKDFVPGTSSQGNTPVKFDTVKDAKGGKSIIEHKLTDKEQRAADSVRYARIKNGIDNINKLYNETIEKQNTTLGLGWGDFGFAADSAKWVKERLKCDSIKNVNVKMKTKLPVPQLRELPVNNFWYKVKAVARPLSLIGFLITALAISLGAPFWFDLLNKFINLRVSGTKPDGKEEDKSNSTQNRKPAPNSFA
jgi:hypothetical protein